MAASRSISDFRFGKVKSSVGRQFICEHHYSGTCHGGPMTWGIFDESENDQLVGVIAFATPISENVRRSIWKAGVEEDMKNKTTELHRLVTLDDCPKNTETWFISRGLDGLKEYKPKYKAVISFADETEGHLGTIYQAANAIYYGTTEESTFYRDQQGRLRPPRQNGVNISKQEARDRGWTVERRKSKHRYLFLIPDKYERKDDIRELMDIDEQPYPSR